MVTLARGGGGGCVGGQWSPTETLGGTIGHEGEAYLLVALGGDAGEGTRQNQLDKSDCAGAGGIPRGVPCRGLHMEYGGADSQGGMRRIQINYSNGGPVKGHHGYH